MVKLKLRQDGWFEIGKDSPKDSMRYKIYESKQAMKKSLEEIGEFESIDALEEALSQAPKTEFYFKEQPYLTGSIIECRVDEHPGEVSLGKIVEEAKYEIEGHPFGEIKGNEIITGRPSSGYEVQEKYDDSTKTLEVIMIEPQRGSVGDNWYHPVTITIPKGTKKIKYTRKEKVVTYRNL